MQDQAACDSLVFYVSRFISTFLSKLGEKMSIKKSAGAQVSYKIKETEKLIFLNIESHYEVSLMFKK